MAPATVRKAVLVTGATGQQGGATVDSLLEAGDAFTVLAVTRNAESVAAKKLKNKGAKVIQGNLDDIPRLLASATRALQDAGQKPEIWGVFSIQMNVGKGASAERERVQGKALIDAAVAHGVQFFVYTSVERGGLERSYTNPTDVPIWYVKHDIEHYLLEKTGSTATSPGNGMQWTILRPVIFMDNITPDFAGKILPTAWRVTLGDAPGRTLQLISTKDIGYVAAEAFRNPDKFKGRAISLAGDSLTLGEAQRVFRIKMGLELPLTWDWLARAFLWYSPIYGPMFKYVRNEGFGADVEALREEFPRLQSFGDWVEKSSKWSKRS